MTPSEGKGRPRPAWEEAWEVTSGPPEPEPDASPAPVWEDTDAPDGEGEPGPREPEPAAARPAPARRPVQPRRGYHHPRRSHWEALDERSVLVAEGKVAEARAAGDAVGTENWEFELAYRREHLEWMRGKRAEEPLNLPWPSHQRAATPAPVVKAPPEQQPPEPPPPTLTPIAMGVRVRYLSGPVDAYGRAGTRDGVVRDWDGVGLRVRLDGDVADTRCHPSRVSEFDVWGVPAHPERVTWLRGDPQPPALVRAEAIEADSPGVARTITVGRKAYPGILG